MANQEANIDQFVENLSALSVLDLSKLKKALEEKWGVTAAAAAVPMMMGAPGGEAAAQEESAEPTEFNLVLAEVPADKKIAVIKAIRETTGLSLKEAKELAEGAPKTIKEGIPKAEAKELEKKFQAAGAKVELQGV